MSPRWVGLAWALVSAVGAALMVIPWKLANEAGDPAVSTLLLLAVAAVGSSALGVMRGAGRRTRRRLGRVDWAVATALAVFTLAGNHLSAVAIQEVSPALMNVLLRSDLVFVAIFGWLLLGERVDGRFWIGLPFVFAGLARLQGPDFEIEPASFLGSEVGLAVGAAACFSGMAIVTRRHIHQLDAVAVNTMRLWMAVVVWFVFNPPPDFLALPRDQVVWSTAAAITGPFLGRLALMQSARYVEARISTLAMLTAPIMSLGLAYLVLDEWPAGYEIEGGALMLVGIAIPLLRVELRR